MSDEEKPAGSSLYRGPAGDKRDKRERERDRARGGQSSEARSPRRDDAYHPAPRVERTAPRRELRERPQADANYDHEATGAPRPIKELRLYGVNACLANFKKHPENLRKVYLLESRIPQFKAALAFCVQNKLGYRVVEELDLQKLTASGHHEGVCFDVLPTPEKNLSDWLHALPPGPCIALWLDGVGNPHNLGAMLRSAAHFGVLGILLPKEHGIGISGAAARVAEGAAEHVPLVRMGRSDNAIAQLKSVGFALAATVVRGGQALYSTKLPERLVLVMGAEQMGVDNQLAEAATFKLGIPGTGWVDSLNVSAATAVLLSEWKRQQS